MRSIRNLAVLGGLVLGVASSIHADSLELLWTVNPGDEGIDFMTTGNTERGMAYNPVTDRVVVISRNGGYRPVVLDAADGSYQWELISDGMSGGTFPVNMVGVAEDGAIYVGNLSTSTTAPQFKLYRYADDQLWTWPEVAFDGDPAGTDPDSGASLNPQRWGDTMDVRGSGANTQVVIASRNTAAIAILTTEDGVTFTSTLIEGAANGNGSLGVAFGAGNTVYTKINNGALRLVSFDLATGTSTLIQSWADPAIPNGVAPIATDAAAKELAGVLYGGNGVNLYNIEDTTQPPIFIDSEPNPNSNANGNGVGSADFGNNRLFVLDTNNGLQAYKIVRSTTAEPPAISTGPADTEVLEGGNVSFSVAATGTLPLSYQWLFGETEIEGATEATLTLTAVTPDQAGEYSVRVTNEADAIVSDPATLTVIPLVKSDALTFKWQIAPGDAPWMATDNAQRGAAVNPVNGNVLVVSRTGGNGVYVLDNETGALLHQLNLEGVSGGTYAVNMVGAAGDGTVYVGNLQLDGTTGNFTLYRWASDAATEVPAVAFTGDPGVGVANRWGDTLDVRGSGIDTQILLGSRSGNVFSVLTTADGENFVANPVAVAGAANGSFGLGITFGAGDTVWGKSAAVSLKHVQFDLLAGTGAIVHEFATDAFPGAIAPIGYDETNNYLAGLAIQSPDKDNVRLFDLADLETAPVVIDEEFCPADNGNTNGTGAVDFGHALLAVLNTNNGLIVFDVQRPSAPVTLGDIAIAGENLTFTVNGAAGVAYGIEATAAFDGWTTVEDAGGTGPSFTVTVPLAGATHRFFRAVEK
ncbi:MAG: DUF4623 domain-containing protein [Verrucomicrobiae bacterium]|nr:DUF4623 domain-containing protein [Verrucomicrobiae bacterium]